MTNWDKFRINQKEWVNLTKAIKHLDEAYALINPSPGVDIGTGKKKDNYYVTDVIRWASMAIDVRRNELHLANQALIEQI